MQPQRHRGTEKIWIFILCASAPLWFNSFSAQAVTTSHWVQHTEKDWKAGKFKDVVVTNLGDVKLSRQVQTLLEEDSRISSVYCMAQTSDGTIYAGTGPQGVLLAIKDGKISTAATLQNNESIFSLAINKKGRLLIGTGGERGRVLELRHGQTKEIFSMEGVQYIWALTTTPDGNIYAATGPSGQLFEIRPDGSHNVLLESHENNLLSLLSDGKDLLYAGSDPQGRIYRINRKTRESFVLYEADESEISALTMDADGNLYAATGEADQAAQNGQPEEAPENTSEGRPEASPGGVQIPSTPPSNPSPPALPQPNPGEPQPIPKSAGNAHVIHTLFEVADAASPPDSGDPSTPPASPEKPDEIKKSSAPKQKSIDAGPAENVGNPVAAGAKGNAIYRIDASGFVTEVFRQPVIVLSMIEQGGKLLVGTGDEGTIYQVDPTAGETVALAEVDAKDVMCLFPASDGRTFMGLANVGGISAMPARLSAQGTYTSAVLDATQISRFGNMLMHGWLPSNTTLKVSTRTGNIETPDDATWSKWTEPLAASQYFSIHSPSARFLQYRLFFSSDDAGKETPIIRNIDVAYQMPNLAPQLHSVRIAPAGKPADAPADNSNPPNPYKPGRGPLTISWDAADPNNDALQYSVYYRQGFAGPWILLKDKLTDATLDWDSRSVPDGQYVVKVVASDAAANPVGQGKTASRISDPVYIDNTPPVIGDLTWSQQAGGAKLKFRVVDAASEIANVEYSVDSSTDWQMAPSSDNIFDSPAESVELTLTGLKPGEHQVSLRATDDHGNQSYQSVLITADAP
jgi:WD40 repeat protein